MSLKKKKKKDNERKKKLKFYMLDFFFYYFMKHTLHFDNLTSRPNFFQVFKFRTYAN
jgi:hypothetical protein